MMFHPSHRVPDLGEAERWFERVFGSPSARLDTFGAGGAQDPENRTDYSTFTVIRDVVFDTIDPELYVKNGVRQYPTVEKPRLNGFGWYVDGLTHAYRALRSRGFQIVDQLGRIVDGDEPPTVVGGGLPMFWTTPDSAGLRYQFLPPIPFPGDPRVQPGWVLPPVSQDDPLGIDMCSHHIVLTADRDRALRLFVDALGGTVIHEGHDAVLSATSTYVHLADGVYELATPDDRTPAFADWATNAPSDTYHAIAFKVVDLDRAERHLRAQGVHIVIRSDDVIVTDPETSLGVPWRFVTALTPGDPRALSTGRSEARSGPRVGPRPAKESHHA
jgi:catechol 2,3-dioxygenase-like lactoylglutathione lyase family enzyme